MAQKVEVLLTCDLDEEPTEAADTVIFAYDGRSYTFELCEDHLAEFTETMTSWAEHARRAGAMNSSSKGSRKTHRRPAGNRAEVTAIREWAANNGYEISDRGRIPVEVRREYEEALIGERLIKEIEVDIAAEPARRVRKRRV